MNFSPRLEGGCLKEREKCPKKIIKKRLRRVVGVVGVSLIRVRPRRLAGAVPQGRVGLHERPAVGEAGGEVGVGDEGAAEDDGVGVSGADALVGHLAVVTSPQSLLRVLDMQRLYTYISRVASESVRLCNSKHLSPTCHRFRYAGMCKRYKVDEPIIQPYLFVTRRIQGLGLVVDEIPATTLWSR